MLAYKGVRVGLFSDYYLASSDGTAIATDISCQALAELGHKVWVFCPSLPSAEPKARVETFHSWPGIIYPGLRLSWPFSRRMLKRANKLDIIHVETPLPVGLAGLWAGRRLNKPVVISAHLDMDFMGKYLVAPLALLGLGLLVAAICRQPLGFIEALFSGRRTRKASRRVDFAWRIFAYFSDQSSVCIAISQKIYDQLKIYKTKDNLVLVPNGISLQVSELPDKLKARRHLGILGIEKNDFIVISVARLVREKRVDLIIRSVASIAGKNPKLKLVVLGEGPQRQRLQKLARDLGVHDKVIFYGLVAHQDLYKYMVAADVFVNASLNEVASLSILEAGLCAKPLALFDRRLVEPLEDGVGGFFVKNSKQLADKITWFINHPTKAAKMGAASRLHIKNRYSRDAHGRQLARVYSTLVKQG